MTALGSWKRRRPYRGVYGANDRAGQLGENRFPAATLYKHYKTFRY
jgi:hypothetical protein